MPRLIINNIEFELPEKTKIAQTKQVNDLISLSSRQSNYTATITLPLTANNVRGMNSLGIIGNNSNIPYQRNSCYYYADDGECFIYNGWAVISSKSNGYKLNIYDGSIDFYKAIENTTLADLDLTEINHTKTLENVVASFNNETIYKYIIADYNGNAVYDTSKINIDYLVPSIPVSWLMDKIAETYGYTFTGSIFNTFNYTNLWMTFPKGLLTTVPDIPYFESTLSWADVGLSPRPAFYMFFFSITTAHPSVTLTTPYSVKFSQEGVYRINISGTVNIATNYIFTYPVGFYQAKNAEGLDPTFIVEAGIKASVFTNTDTDIDTTYLININAEDSLSYFFRMINIATVMLGIGGSLNITISKVENTEIDFDGAFLDFKTKDFINEINWRFGTTPYKNKYSKEIQFLTMQEVLQTTNVIDWSDKYVEFLDEVYIYGNYAKENALAYKYNDDESDFNNGYINIDNENLNDSTTIIQSKIYSPEKEKSFLVPFEKRTNIYKLWEKEVSGDGIKYKSLDKRFYFMRYEDYTFTFPTTVGSESLETSQSIAIAPFESFFKLPFSDIVNDYYSPFNQILNKSRVLTLNLFLNDVDIENLNFIALYYFKQEGGYFLLNKVINYSEKGRVKCEFIKVDYVNQIEPIVDNLLTLSYNGTCFEIENFESFTGGVYLNYGYLDGTDWANVGSVITETPYCLVFEALGYYRLVNEDGFVISNTIIL